MPVDPNRTVHKVGWAQDIGTFAELTEKLGKQGFTNSNSRDYFNTGIYKAKNATGKIMTMKRVERGREAKYFPKPQGATSWLAYRGAGPDTWVITGKRRKKQ